MAKWTIKFTNSLTRFVQVIKNELNKPKKYIYLTFDDGPLSGTDGTIELCRSLEVNATYFMTGCHCITKKDMQTIEFLHSMSHQFLISNHSFSHANLRYSEFYKNPLAVVLDFEKAEKILRITKKIARLPAYNAWANSTSFTGPPTMKTVCDAMIQSGYVLVGWDIEWKLDWTNSFFSYLFFRVKLLSKLFFLRTMSSNHIVLLLHDFQFTEEQNLGVLKRFITSFLKSKKYSFEIVASHPIFNNSLD